MKKYQYASIGNSVEQTMLPFIHERLFELSNINAEYTILNTADKPLKEMVQELKKFSGYNVSVPYKVSIKQYLDKLHKKAEFYGAVNTVKNTVHNNNIVSKGYITDVYGFVEALKTHKMPIDGKVVIVGSGGAAKVLACELAIKGCHPTLSVEPKYLKKVAKIAGAIREKVINMEIETCRLDRLNGDIDLLINATPCGSISNIDECPLDENIINHCKNVMDLVYNPLETKLMKIARANGANVINGLSMLIWQAVKSHEIWTDVCFSNDDIIQLYDDAEKVLQA